MQSYIWFPYTSEVRVEHFSAPVIDLRDEKGRVLPPTEDLSPAIKNKKAPRITEHGEKEASFNDNDLVKDEAPKEVAQTVGVIQHTTVPADELDEKALSGSAEVITTTTTELGTKAAGTELKKKLSNLSSNKGSIQTT
eukprot:PhF_6_TR21465/c0_g1_i1/m.30765